MKILSACVFIFFFLQLRLIAQSSEYYLTIAKKPVYITGKSTEKLTVNGAIPGPTLYFREGEEAIIHVTNAMDEDTSIHWHGILLPSEMDGVPGFSGFPGIKPGESFSYHFELRQSGTYWYHAHSMGQEQDGVYGSIVITPGGKDMVESDRDYVILISEFHKENSDTILANLKMSSDYYQYARRTLGDFIVDARQHSFGKALNSSLEWGKMRMLRTDLSDVTGYTFLVNGKTPDQNWTGIFRPGDRVRLRFINASAMSFFDVRIPGLKMQVVAADGQNVEPVSVDEFRFGAAETYDVIVNPKENKAFTIVAEPIDRTGFALGTLATHEGMRGIIPRQRKRALLTMADMNMGEMMKDSPNMDMSNPDTRISGWAKTGIPDGEKELSYSDLRYLGTQKDTRTPDRTIEVLLGGNMERYIWTINNKKYFDSAPIDLKYGERVRIKFINETMMAHPMHLHGMFVQLENGQPAEKLPNKHTVIVPPGQTYSVLLTVDEPGEWAFHCHLLYHMLSGMMKKVVVASLDPTYMPPGKSGMQMNNYDDHTDHSKMNHDM